MRDHYLSTSKKQEADFYRKLWLTKACLHPNLIDDFKQCNQQLVAYEIDARNSDRALPTYYDKAAKLINSNIVLYTIAIGMDYGEPF